MEGEYNTLEAARIMGFAAQTLNNWRHAGKGPRFTKSAAGHVTYRAEDIAEFMRSREAKGTK
jgi:predicted site-specific integrase-resolvase